MPGTDHIRYTWSDFLVLLCCMPDSLTISILSLVVASLSLAGSSVLAWLIYFRRGTLRMTRPSMIVFAHDGSIPKIFLRTLLYSTGMRGHVVEAMFLKVRRGESACNLSTWGYGNQGVELGSGLRVGVDGAGAFYHHFLPPKHATEFKFLPGQYEIEVYAQLADTSSPVLLSTMSLSLTEEQSGKLMDTGDAALFYEWGPASKTYTAQIETRPKLLRDERSPGLP